MNMLVKALEQNNTTTTNGDGAFLSTDSKVLDFFYKSAASRGSDVSKEFIEAFSENPDVAIRSLLWLRDVREGAGERQQFKNCVLAISAEESVCRVINKIPEIGRFDDLLVFVDTAFENKAFAVISSALKSGNALCAKWMPRQGAVAKKLAKYMGFKNEAQWRKYIVSLSSTVEQKMCSKQWDNIDFNSVPSVASARYQSAFKRNSTTYQSWVDGLENGESKVNAGALYPYDVIKSLSLGNSDVAQAQWDALPDYLQGSNEKFLPIVDVSGSMLDNVNSSTTCMDVAISLGLYLSERNNSAFKDVVVTFSASPEFIKLDAKSLYDRVYQVKQLPWGMNTDIEAVFKRLLELCVSSEVPKEDMPTSVLIVSDMQFDKCIYGSSAMDSMKELYKAHGYSLPKVVFWTVNAKAGNVPVKQHEHGACLVSGFSPSILKGILAGGMTPHQVMLDTLMIERYS